MKANISEESSGDDMQESDFEDEEEKIGDFELSKKDKIVMASMVPDPCWIN